MRYRQSHHRDAGHLRRISTRNFEVRKSKQGFDGGDTFVAVYVRGKETTPQSVAKRLWTDLGAASTEWRYAQFEHIISSASRIVAAAVPGHGVVLKGVVVDESRSVPPLARAPAEGWYLVRLMVRGGGGRPGHVLLLAVHNRRAYVYDPNGNAASGTDAPAAPATDAPAAPATVRAVFAAAAKAIGVSLDLDAADTWLFKDQRINQSLTLRWMESEGLCGAFVEFVTCVILLNSRMGPKELRRVVAHRIAQWDDFRDSRAQMRKQIDALRRLSDPSVVRNPHSREAWLASDERVLDQLRRTCTTEADVARHDALLAEVRAARAVLHSADEVARFNRKVHAINASVERQNAFATLAFRYPLDAYAECPEMRSVWVGGDSAEEHVARALDSFKLSKGHAQVRRELIESGSFLDWFEMQAVMFIAYALELVAALNEAPPRVIDVERASDARWSSLLGRYRWDETAREYVGGAGQTISRAEDGERRFRWTLRSARARFTLAKAVLPPGFDEHEWGFRFRIVEL